MIKRLLSKKIKALCKSFPAISLTGPRQSGKTTLAKTLFPEYDYASLEDADVRRGAQEDPRGFLRGFKKRVILDEVQKAPELFSYLQGIIDESKKPGQFILTGSQNFLLMENITQSLAGRVAVNYLLPFGLNELQKTDHGHGDLDHYLFSGMYPPLYDRKISPQDWYGSYVTTYLERDVRQIKQVTNLNTFQNFMQLCAGRSGQLLNLSELGNACGITHNTAKAWLSVLQASFIVFFLQPYYKNFNKRLVKQPKLYFYDTGLLCSLLGIKETAQLKSHYMRGAIFETFMVSEIMKHHHHRGEKPRLYFWRDHVGNEVDCLIEKDGKLFPVEIKSGATVNDDYFNGLCYFNKVTGTPLKKAYLIYGGGMSQNRKQGHVLGWQDYEKLF